MVDGTLPSLTVRYALIRDIATKPTVERGFLSLHTGLTRIIVSYHAVKTPHDITPFSKVILYHSIMKEGYQ